MAVTVSEQSRTAISQLLHACLRCPSIEQRRMYCPVLDKLLSPLLTKCKSFCPQGKHNDIAPAKELSRAGPPTTSAIKQERRRSDIVIEHIRNFCDDCDDAVGGGQSLGCKHLLGENDRPAPCRLGPLWASPNGKCPVGKPWPT